MKTVFFDFPDYVPVIFHINLSCWDHYPRAELAALIESHPLLFPDGVPDFVQAGEPVPYPPWCIEGSPWADPWGCTWETPMSGLVGCVTQHALESLNEVSSLTPPDPRHTTHWYPVTWEKGRAPHGGSIGFFDCLRSGEIGHGHTFLKLMDILGFENTIYGLVDGDPRMLTLLEMLEEFNYGLVQRFIDYAHVEWLGYAEDLGMQQGPMLSPDLFRRYIVPSYRRIMEPAEQHDVIIHMHSDGDITTLADDLLTLPIRALNIQDTANGIEWIRRHLKGRLAVDLDIDRQHITRTGTPQELRRYVGDIVRTLGDPAGGLVLTFGLYPGTPLENVKALMEVLENVRAGTAP